MRGLASTQEVLRRVSRTDVPPGSAEGQRAWVFRIARNLALYHLRDQQRQPLTTTLVDVGRTGTQELGAAVQQALASLSELDRDVFVLKESAGLGYEEIVPVKDDEGVLVGHCFSVSVRSKILK